MNTKNKILLALLPFALVASAHAEGEISDAQTALTTGVTACGTIAALIATIYAGVLVFKKISKYFNKIG